MEKQEKRRYISSANYIPGQRGIEHNTDPSLTIPGETMTIKEIIARFGQGQDPDENRAGYLDEEDLEKIDYYFAPGSLDLTDISALAEKVKVLTEIHDKAKKAQDEIAKAEADKAAIEEAEHKAAVKAWNKDQAEKKKAKPKPED